jgi:hypothetical protein
MFSAILSITLAVFGVMALGLCLAYWAQKFYRTSQINLFEDGYLLTHPQLTTVGFSCPNKANEFAKRAKAQGKIYDIYGVYRGKITYCGRTTNTIC